MNSLNINIVRTLIVLFVVLSVSFVVVLREQRGVLYSQLSKASIFKGIVQERNESIVLAKGATLSFDQPSFQNIVSFILDKRVIDPNDLENYQSFFERAERLYPNVPDIEGVLGVISYYRGETSKAVYYLQNAVRLNGSSFWFSYNLGLIYYKNNDFRKAAQYFLSATQKDIAQNVGFIHRSEVYNFIFDPQINLGGYEVEKNLRKGVAGSYYYLGLSEKALGNEKKGKELVEKAQELMHNISVNQSSFPDVQFF